MCNLSEAIWEEGIEKGRLMQLYELIKAGTITTEQAAKSLNMTVDSFNCKLKSIQE